VLFRSTVKSGKSTSLRVEVAAGEMAVTGVKACASVPKLKRKAIKVGSCRSIGSLAPGNSVTARLKVKTTARARGKYRITTRVTGDGTREVTRTASLKVKK